MMYLLLGAAVLLAGAFYLYKEKGLSLSADEQLIVNKLVTEKQKLLADFVSGKEVILSEYENLKADVEKALGLQAKLPVAPIIASSPAPQKPIRPVIVPISIPVVPVETPPIPVPAVEPPPAV